MCNKTGGKNDEKQNLSFAAIGADNLQPDGFECFISPRSSSVKDRFDR
jgi:hypothetical protein